MSRGQIILAAIALDLLLGDPQGYPHPVRWIARWARILERGTYERLSSKFAAGALTALTVYATTYGLCSLLLFTAEKAHPGLRDFVSVLMVYSSIALRDLIGHSRKVYQALAQGSLELARRRVGMLVARETQELPPSEIVRACVESVAENMVDGVTAPLFFAVFGGPAAALLYRAINTLDSLFGYKNERYRRFGTVSARVDDIANFVPARLTAPCVAVAAALLGLHPWWSLRTAARDGHKHPSPNSGLSEAAVAGALGVQLGGTNLYGGVASTKPTLGFGHDSLSARHIVMANRLVFLSCMIASMAFLACRQWLWRMP